MGSDLFIRGYRAATTAQVKIGEFDFVLVGLHLKAGRGADATNYRNQQLGVVSGYIQGIMGTGENDIVVIGDYNMIPERDSKNFNTLNAIGFMRYVSSEKLSGQGSHIKKNYSIGNLLDGYGLILP